MINITLYILYTYIKNLMLYLALDKSRKASMLHIIDKFPIQHSFLATTHSGDTLILKDNAVYAAKQENLNESLTMRAFAHLNLCVSKTDLLKRNISNRELVRGVAVLDCLDDYQDYLAQNIALRSCN